MNQIEGFNISEHLDAYKIIFDIIRIVDPAKKKIIKYQDNGILSDAAFCCSLQLDNRECSKCIISKSIEEQKTFIKVQHNRDKMLLMFATPIEIKGNMLVLELIKDITDDLVFETVFQGQERRVQNIIEDLNNLIMKDPLTNLYNRRYIDQMLPIEISNCSNRKQPISIAMIDIDHFKDINDAYGHGAGDAVIKAFAQLLSRYIRSNVDWVARYGGEEFLICLPNTDSKKAYMVVERIRKAIERTIISVGNKKIQITGSFGLFTVKDKKLAYTDLIKCADAKLYQAKNQGRNKVVL